jgi:hypothetical protein
LRKIVRADYARLTGVVKGSLLAKVPKLVVLYIANNYITSRDLSDSQWGTRSIPQLLSNSSYSLLFDVSWVNESKRTAYITIENNQLSGYVPKLASNTMGIGGNILWCTDKYAPANMSFNYAVCNDNSSLVCPSGCTNIKIFHNKYPAMFYPYEDALINLTIIAPTFLTDWTLMGVTQETTDINMVNSTANITRNEFEPGFDSNTSSVQVLVQYPKLTLTKALSDFDSDKGTPVQQVPLFYYFGATLTQNLWLPVLNSCYTGNGYSKDGQVCSACSPGLYQQRINQVPQCVPCPVGTYQERPGQTFCVSCLESSTTIGTGSNSRDSCLCPPQTFGNGWSECFSCPSGSSSFLGARQYSDCFCKSGFYGQAYRNVSCHSCEVYINNEKITECINLNMTVPSVTNGWYSTDLGAGDGSLKFLKCTPASSCVNGGCSAGYTGYLCGICVPLEFYRQDLSCKKCSNNAGLAWTGLVLCVLVLDFFMLRGAYPSATKTVTVGITITWIQIISLFAEIPVNWPPSILSVYSAFSFSNFNVDLFSPECSVPLTFWGKWLFKLLVPVLVFVGMFLIFLIQEIGARLYPYRKSVFLISIWPKFSRSSKEDLVFISNTNDPFRYSRYIYAPVLILTIFYSFLTSLSFQPFMCVAQDDGTYTMAMNSSANCFDREWLSHLPTTIFFILLYPVGIPVALGIVFWKNMEKSETKGFRKLFGGVTLSYRSHLFWWEAVDLIRRASIVMLLKLLFLFQMKYLQLFLAVLVLFLYQIFYVFLQPFKRAEMNFLTTCWMISSIICLFSGVVFKVGELQSFERTAFAVVVITILSACFLLSAWVLFLELSSHNRIMAMQDAKGANFFSIVETRRKILQERCPDTHELIWTQVAYMSLAEQDRFFKEFVRLERVEKQVKAVSMLDDETLPEFAYSHTRPAEKSRGSNATLGKTLTVTSVNTTLY